MKFYSFHTNRLRPLFYLVLFGVILYSCELKDVVSPSERDTFVKYLGTQLAQKGHSFIQDTDGSIILVGESGLSPNRGIYIVQSDALGNPGNEIIIDSLGYDESVPVITKSNDGQSYIIAFERNISQTKSILVVTSIDKNLSENWTNVELTDTTGIGITFNKRFSPSHILAAKDGGYIISGTTTNEVSGVKLVDIENETLDNQLFIVKIDQNGQKEWQLFYGDSGYDGAIKTFENDRAVGNYIIAYNSDTRGVEFGTFSEANNNILGNTSGGLGIKEAGVSATDVIQYEYLKFYVLCQKSNGLLSDFSIVGVNWLGGEAPFTRSNTLSEGNVTIAGRNMAYSFKYYKQSLFVAGSIGESGDEDYHLSKINVINSSYVLEWQKSFGTDNEDVAYNVDVNDNGNITMLGYMSLRNTIVLGLIKLDSDGNFKN